MGHVTRIIHNPTRGCVTALGARIIDNRFVSNGQGLPGPRPMRKCLQCPNEHNHNNAFCSAECNRQHKLAKQEKTV